MRWRNKVRKFVNKWEGMDIDTTEEVLMGQQIK
jgi:hypothetical protein